jgi:hypothetical protein
MLDMGEMSMHEWEFDEAKRTVGTLMASLDSDKRQESLKELSALFDKMSTQFDVETTQFDTLIATHEKEEREFDSATQLIGDTQAQTHTRTMPPRTHARTHARTHFPSGVGQCHSGDRSAGRQARGACP